ncbi:hypothetical protein [Catenulispora pinisilvae]|uniref:hypothetical protein n=1 Tax=Catenulispora pinisilvae TaxID=2705253 RepID=UPI00189246AE|nr:hypothetical protein [Catenulispora pinisilvae]
MDPRAVAAYGYDFAAGPKLTAQPDDPTPPWQRSHEVFYIAAERRLLELIGGIDGPDDPQLDPMADPADAVAEHLGVKVVDLGYDHPMEGFLLAATSAETNWDKTKDIDLTIPDGAEQNLNRAARLLGLDTGDQQPRWMLAAYQS